MPTNPCCARTKQHPAAANQEDTSSGGGRTRWGRNSEQVLLGKFHDHVDEGVAVELAAPGFKSVDRCGWDSRCIARTRNNACSTSPASTAMSLIAASPPPGPLSKEHCAVIRAAQPLTEWKFSAHRAALPHFPRFRFAMSASANPSFYAIGCAMAYPEVRGSAQVC